MFKHFFLLKQSPKTVKLFIVVFYFIGIVGFMFPPTKEIFIKLIPFALLLSFGLLMLFNETEINKKTLIAFSIILTVSFMVEAIGVKTGMIFGNYTYGNGLGFQLFNTPLIIAINWLFMVYASAVVVRKIKVKSFLKVILASCVMVVYDGILEQMAPKLDMWKWDGDVVPIQNYVAWFIFALLFHFILGRMKIDIKNKIAKMLFFCQFLFFVILFLVSCVI
ncbi:carotenoid biosynthesis protein [Bacteroidales bacterium]|nr:carotenoid biosynthesis protein [Bacteroidales bacterium]